MVTLINYVFTLITLLHFIIFACILDFICNSQVKLSLSVIFYISNVVRVGGCFSP